MPTIGLYMPQWLYRSDTSDRQFFDGLVSTIERSGRYRPLVLDLEKLHLTSKEDAERFCREQNLVAVVQHHSIYFSKSIRYRANVDFLQDYVRFFNSLEAHAVGHNKIRTKQILKAKSIPVLDDVAVAALKDFEDHIEEDNLYVIKPHDNGAGAGVKLIKKSNGDLFGYRNGAWRAIQVKEKSLKNGSTRLSVGYDPRVHTLMALWEPAFTYAQMLIEPYFNDDETVFTSLRCTVIGNNVVESVKRTNTKNITSNISSGGVATPIELSDYQKQMAVAASNAVGADYAGVDLLVRGNESVIGEVNIGPFTLFGRYTGVDVGKLFGDYVVQQCDQLKLFSHS